MANDTEPNNRILELLDRIGRNQAWLARQVHSDAATVNKLIHGHRGLDQEWMRRLAGPLECQPADLLPRHDNPFLLSDEERELIRRLRVSDDRQRETFDRVADAMLPGAPDRGERAA